MLQIIRSEYGSEINTFEFDYLGGHAGLEDIILNAAPLQPYAGQRINA